MRITKPKLFFIALAALTLLAGHFSGGSSQAAAAVDDLLVFIEGDSFVQAINLGNCTGFTAHGVNFRVTGGTGVYAGATGGGRFNLFSNLTPCNGQVVPATVSFEGHLKRANP